jgi:aspartate dehydrogenase
MSSPSHSTIERCGLAGVTRVGLIGLGAIGAAIVDLWGEQIGPRADLAALLVRNTRLWDAARRVAPGVLVTSSLEDFLRAELDAVVEAAGHGAVADYGEAILLRGCELFVLSAGALADERLHAKLLEAAERGGGRIAVLSGALAGFDGLLSMGRPELGAIHLGQASAGLAPGGSRVPSGPRRPHRSLGDLFGSSLKERLALLCFSKSGGEKSWVAPVAPR